MRGGRGNLRGMRGGAGRSARPTQNNAQLRSSLMVHKTNATKRLQKDLKELRDQEVPLVGVSATPIDDSIFIWHANLKAPSDSVYYGGVFHLQMDFPQNYPVNPPVVTLLGYQLDHPNVFGSKLCLDMLEQTKGGAWYEGWNSAYTVESILIQLQSFLFDKPKVKKTCTKEESEEQYKEIIQMANSYKCTMCKHKGPIEPYPPFDEKEADKQAFCIMRDPQQMILDELVCYHTRVNLSDSSLGIGVSVSRLPRTGEIRSVTPCFDLLSLRAFQKQSVRQSINGDKFTHWLPLYFGEDGQFEKKTQIFNEDKKEYENRVEVIKPKERMVHLLKKSLCYLTKKDTRKPFTPEMVVEVMPKLMITAFVDIVSGEKHHISLVAIRRIFNFIRLFHLLFELQPDSVKQVDEKIKVFKEQKDKRVKDHCSSLGDILSYAIVSNQFAIEDILDAYLEEQLDRQAFWIIRQIPELDHTDEKYKGKEIVLEDARNEVCFKTGQVGFNITMLCFTINELLQQHFGGDLKKLVSTMDANHGCLPADIENSLQIKMKSIKRVDNFNKYYTWVKRSCPDAQALSIRLRQSITNSKEKRYHGSTEHMNVLPTMEVQATTHLLAEPSPFSHFDESSNKFVKDVKDPFWKEACLKKFDWIKSYVYNHMNDETPAAIACESDRREMQNRLPYIRENALAAKHVTLRQDKWVKSTILSETLSKDYDSSKFTWRHLFHKLCFEQMIQNLGQSCDFKLMYKYIQLLGPEIQVLRIPTIDKTNLKSNQYWIMAIVSKMVNLKIVKLHKPLGGSSLGKHGWKFLTKGFTYMKENGRDLEKFQMTNMNDASEDLLYASLKLHQNLIVLKFNDLKLSANDSKAIGKILSDFKQIRELDLNGADLDLNSTKDIADGLMRAKALEIIKVSNNPNMGKSVNAIIYNLAFSPKIRFIDLESMSSADPDTAEALYKLLNISGSVETINLYNCNIIPTLKEDFYKAVGQNKTLRYLNLGLNTQNPSNWHLLAKSISMNGKKGGSLKGVDAENWFTTASRFNQFLEGLKISEQDHEFWYGDKNVASKMTKEDVFNKSINFALDYFMMGGSKTNLSGQNFRPKQILAQVKPEWPTFLKFASACKDLVIDLDQAKLHHKDMEMMAYAIGENPTGACSIKHMSIKKCPINKEGAKFLAPALALNKSLVHLDLSSCKLGVSGVMRISESMKDNKAIKSMNLYRNIFDVDGARAIGKMLEVNKTLEFLDIGHNRIRETGLKAIVDGIEKNNGSKLSQISICANFINDDGLNILFDRLVFGKKQQMTHIYIKQNFQTEYNKISLSQKVQDKGIKVFVDDFRAIDYLVKEKLERSIWISPTMASETLQGIRNVMLSNEVGYITDIRLSQSSTAPGRPKPNQYAIVEFSDPNSINRSLQLASKGKSVFSGQRSRIYRSGTQTAIIQPRQARR